MLPARQPVDHPSIKGPKIGVLLLNLGTPDSPDYWPMRRYLGEFLSDRRVIEVNPLFWQVILQGIILNTRPQKSGANYRKIWDAEAGDSPLRVITRRQAEKLQARLGDKVIVDFAMRYGNPSTELKLKALQAQGCTRILLCPLYPNIRRRRRRRPTMQRSTCSRRCAGSRQSARCRRISTRPNTSRH